MTATPLINLIATGPSPLVAVGALVSFIADGAPGSTYLGTVVAIRDDGFAVVRDEDGGKYRVRTERLLAVSFVTAPVLAGAAS